MNPPKIYGLIGYPVKHSLSPLMHNAAFAALGIDAKYELFEVSPGELGDFFKSIPQRNILGFNVTIPHKEKVIALLDQASEEARLIGAVNTVKVEGAKTGGFNTDGAGFLKYLKEELRFDPKGKRIALIGAGGAAKAIAVYLCKAAVKSVSIHDIDNNKLLNLGDQLKKHFAGIEFLSASSVEQLNIASSDLLVNATPIGMKETDPCLVDGKFIKKDLLVYDCIYNPEETKLLRIARGKGAKVANGLGMLLYQAADSFKIWTGKEAPVNVMKQALKERTKHDW